MQTFPIQSPNPFNNSNRTVYVQRTPAPVLNRVQILQDNNVTGAFQFQPRQLIQPSVIEAPQPKSHFVIYRSPCEKVI